MAVRLSALGSGRPSPPGRFLVLISVRGWLDPRAIMRLEGLGQLKKSTSSRTRTSDLPACSVVPQPTTLPHTPIIKSKLNKIITLLFLVGYARFIDSFLVLINRLVAIEMLHDFPPEFTGYFCVCKLLSTLFQYRNIAFGVGWSMVDELERIWKEAVWYYPGICLEELNKFTKPLSVGSLWTEHLRNTSPEGCHHSNLFRPAYE
jgi:hypothetical protein